MDSLPKPLREVVEQLSSLPGIGPKSALRIALTMLKMPRERAEGVGQSIIDLRSRLCLCERCAGLSESSPCPTCSDQSRDMSQLCLVAEWDSMLALEEMGMYRGLYLVLGGLISPLDGTDAENLEFDRLRSRLAEGDVEEMILALGSTLESEATATYIKNMVETSFSQVRVSRLAQGIPIGAEVKYMDRETLKLSLMHRQEI